jgi:hypothetical protein
VPAEREIRAYFDRDTIVVYQAYNSAIAGRFVKAAQDQFLMQPESGIASKRCERFPGVPWRRGGHRNLVPQGHSYQMVIVLSYVRQRGGRRFQFLDGATVGQMQALVVSIPSLW